MKTPPPWTGGQIAYGRDEQYAEPLRRGREREEPIAIMPPIGR
jgi:hypothetical protein